MSTQGRLGMGGAREDLAHSLEAIAWDSVANEIPTLVYM